MNVIVALLTGVAGSRAAATLLPCVASPRVVSWLAGAAGGVTAAAIAATAVAAQRAVPLPATATSAGIDVASLIANAAAGAIGGIVIAIVAGLIMRVVRAR
ncbi:MAG: hypothetical protein ABI881_05655 [Betaproteobacteria bacterium]